MVKFTKEDAKKLSTLGEEGLLREMILSGMGWRTKNEWFEYLAERDRGVSGSKLSERMKSLEKKRLVEKNVIRKPVSRRIKVEVYRPDALENALDLFRPFNVRDDFRTFLKEVRHRFRLTCLSCGYSENKRLRQTLRLRCPKCGSFNIRVEYPKLLDPHENSENTL